MKKAKIFLTAAGILSVIAGVFAFKAQHRFAGPLVCFTAGHVNTYQTRYTITTTGNKILTCTLPDGLFKDATTYKVVADA